MNDNKLEPTSFLESIHNIWTNSLGMIKDIFTLFSLEVKLAGRSLATILMMVTIAALLLFSCWFSLLGALIAWLMTLHFNLVLSLLLASAINLILAIAIGIYIVKISNNLRFKETRKQLEMVRHDDETITSEN